MTDVSGDYVEIWAITEDDETHLGTVRSEVSVEWEGDGDWAVFDEQGERVIADGFYSMSAAWDWVSDRQLDHDRYRVGEWADDG